MSVVVPKRSPTDELMMLQKKSYELYSYALGKIEPGGILQKCSRYVLRHIENHSYNLCVCIDNANSMDLHSEATERRREQEAAKRHLSNLRTSVYLAYACRRFKERTLLAWDGKIDEVGRILDGWMKSDRKRLKDANSKISEEQNPREAGAVEIICSSS